jgi:hypothetical protein
VDRQDRFESHFWHIAKKGLRPGRRRPQIEIGGANSSRACVSVSAT